MPGKKRLSQKEINYAMDYLAVNLLYNDEINKEWTDFLGKYGKKNTCAEWIERYALNEQYPMRNEDVNEMHLTYHNKFTKDFQEGYLNNYGYKIQKGDGIIGYHYANNQLDLYGIVEKFCRLPAEQQNEMPKLKELLRELTPVAHAVFRPYMRFATADLGLDEAYDDRGDGFDPYRPVPNSAGGFDITEKMNISEEEKERFLDKIRNGAKENTLRSDYELKNMIKLFPNLSEDLRNVKNAYDSRPKTAWWHKKPAEDSTVRKAERAYEDLISSIERGDSVFDLRAKLEAVKKASQDYLNEKDTQKGVDTSASMEARLAANKGKRTSFGAGRYEAFWKINEFCTKKLEALQTPDFKKAEDKYLEAKAYEEYEKEQWKAYDEVYDKNIEKIEEIDEKIKLKGHEEGQGLPSDPEIKNLIHDRKEILVNFEGVRIPRRNDMRIGFMDMQKQKKLVRPVGKDIMNEINPGGNVSSGNKHISNNINTKKTEKLL